MGRTILEKCADMQDKSTRLRLHLSVNFYPPLPERVKTTMVEEFQRHWKDRCHSRTLLDRINRRLKKNNDPIVGLNVLDRFNVFVLPEDEIVGTPPKEKNKWAFPESKVARIIKNVEAVLKSEDADRLSDEAYKFISLKMGFIAHYNLFGFRDVYRNNIREFAEGLLCGEGHIHGNMAGLTDVAPNEHEADRMVQDKFFTDSYGSEYCQRSAEALRGICKAARVYLREGEKTI